MSAIAAQEIVAKNAELWSIRARDWAAAQDRDERADFIEGVRRTGIGSGTSVLDLGCGTGGFSLRAAQAGAPVTGIDVAPGMVEVARERVPSGHFDVGDMQSLPYEDSSFDVIAAFHSLQFAPSPSAVLAEVARVRQARGEGVHRRVGPRGTQPTRRDRPRYLRTDPRTPPARGTGAVRAHRTG